MPGCAPSVFAVDLFGVRILDHLHARLNLQCSVRVVSVPCGAVCRLPRFGHQASVRHQGLRRDVPGARRDDRPVRLPDLLGGVLRDDHELVYLP